MSIIISYFIQTTTDNSDSVFPNYFLSHRSRENAQETDLSETDDCEDSRWDDGLLRKSEGYNNNRPNNLQNSRQIWVFVFFC